MILNAISFINTNWKKILVVIFVSCLIHGIIGTFKNIKIPEILIYFPLNLVFFFVTWGMGFIVLKFQNINPFCPKAIYKFFCYFVILIGIIGTVYGLVSETVFSAIYSSTDYNKFAISPACFGFVSSGVFLFNKEQHTTNKTITNIENTKDDKKKKIIKYSFFVVIIALFIFSLFLFVNNIFASSEPYKYSLNKIENNKLIREYLGLNYKLNGLITGSMSTKGDGTGIESISFELKGINGISKVYVDAEQENNIWIYKKIVFYKQKASSESIDLLSIEK